MQARVQRLGRVEDTWQRRLAESLEADKAAGAARGGGGGGGSPEALATAAHSATSLKVLSELATFGTPPQRHHTRVPR